MPLALSRYVSYHNNYLKHLDGNLFLLVFPLVLARNAIMSALFANNHGMIGIRV